MKLPYEYICDNAFRLIDLSVMIESYYSENVLDEYHQYLHSCGWTDDEFDTETLRRVDVSWDIFIN